MTLERPEGWTDLWRLHASWRPDASEEWRGSWNYGTDEDTLTLNAVRAAEWRFRLTRGTERGEEPLIYTVLVREGEEVVIAR